MEIGRGGEGTEQHDVVLNHHSRYMLIFVIPPLPSSTPSAGFGLS